VIPRKINNFIDKDNLELHFLKTIVDNDRRLRFGGSLGDDAVKTYLKSSFDGFGINNMWFIVDVESPETFGRKVVATCHVNYDVKTNTAELGLTVSPEYRNQKLGQELYNRGVTWARMKGAEIIFMHCLSENTTMQHIARKNGMSVVTLDPTEKQSSIKVDKNQIAAGYQDSVYEQMAVFDMMVRNQSWFFINFLKMFKK
jgi:RimJ/RimL family protein N-acetyltransferase